ncbi:MAG TPA: right-handed parallel beta-helix repeat-containing protein [Verrucomicrobiae bacterium]|nr:right-handed parallel beta-helix repeat-containing protein [Verrucomicrobiae bacterium]
MALKLTTRLRPILSSRVLTLVLCFATIAPAFAATYYVATNGADTNPGTSNSPFATIMRAQTASRSNDTVYLRGGTYFLNNAHLTRTNNPWAIVNYITTNGVKYLAFPGERPVFDFSAVVPTGYRVTAFLVAASDCTFLGFDVVGVTINVTGVNSQSECFRVTGSRNRFERLAMHDGMGIGWYLTSGSSNLVLNCDAYNNRGLDGFSMGNIDGFGAHPNSTGGRGNVFRGCRAWFNSDDGFDLINAKAAVVIEHCWAFYNGYFTNFASSGGDANGFKSGGYGVSGGDYPTPVPRHVTRFCLAVRNRASGFYANHHPGALDWFNNTAYRNARNFNMLGNLDAESSTNDVPGFDHVMKNNLGYRATVSEVVNLGATNDVTFNYFTLPVTVTSNDFLSLDESLPTAPRRANGDSPYIAFAQLVSGSDLLNAGTNAGFGFVGAAPDLGAFEYGKEPPPTLTLARDGTNLVFHASGGPAGGTNHLVATTDVSLPMKDGLLIATNVFDSVGTFVFTNAVPETPQLFYRIRLP